MDTKELIASELERAALAASDALQAARAALKRLPPGDARRAQMVRIQGLAVEHERCLQALFHNEFAKNKR